MNINRFILGILVLGILFFVLEFAIMQFITVDPSETYRKNYQMSSIQISILTQNMSYDIITLPIATPCGPHPNNISFLTSYPIK